MKTKRKRLISLKNLKKKCWKLTSELVRKSSADSFTGLGVCFTCEKVVPWRELQAGHYIHNKLDFDLRNLKAQCQFCNHYRRGELGIYGEKLNKIYGQAWIDQLRKDARERGNDYKRSEIMEIMERYQILLKNL